MPYKQFKKTKKLIIPLCAHDYIKTDGITTCTKCDFKSILYLMPLKK